MSFNIHNLLLTIFMFQHDSCDFQFIENNEDGINKSCRSMKSFKSCMLGSGIKRGERNFKPVLLMF